MRTDVYYGGAESLESLSPGMDCGEVGFAFDLQRFADNDVVLVVKDGDKVTLNLNTEWRGNDRWLLLPNGDSINLSALRSSNTELNVKDSAGHTYGTLDHRAFVTLSSPAAGAAPINEVSAQGSVEIFNGKYLAEKTKCSHVRVGQSDVLIVLKDDNQDGASVSVAQNSDAVAEMVYHHDGYLLSAKNGRVVINGTYAVLTSDTYVEHKWVMPCELLADSDGKLTVVAGIFFANGAISVHAGSDTELWDEAGKRLAVFNTPYKNGAMVVEAFKGIYDGANKKISPTQGSFAVGGGRYVVNDKDKTMELWETDENGYPTELVTKRAYADIAKVSFPLPEDASTLSGANDYGLTLDIKTVTVTATDTLSLEVPSGFDTVVYQNENGTTRFATLQKKTEGYELAVGVDTPVTVNREMLTGDLTLTNGAVKLTAGESIYVNGTEYTATQAGTKLAVVNGDATLTAGEVRVEGLDPRLAVGDFNYSSAESNDFIMAYDNGVGRLISGAVNFCGELIVGNVTYTASGWAIMLLKNDYVGLLIDGAVWLDYVDGVGESVYVDGTEYTATQAGTNLSVENGKATLIAGEVSFDGGASLYADGTEYTAAANGTKLAINDKKEVTLTAGAVELDYANGTGESIYVNGTEYTATQAGTRLAVVDGNATLTAGGVVLDYADGAGESIYVNDKQYTAAGTGATLALDESGTVELYDGTVWFAAGGSVKGSYGRTYTAAGTGATVSLTETNDISLEGGEVSLTGGSSIYVGETYYSVSKNGTATLAYAGTNEAKLVSGEVELKGYKKILIGEKEYTAYETGATFALAADGTAALKKGGISLAGGDSFAIDGTTYTTGQEGAALCVDGTGNTGTELRSGEVAFAAGSIVIGGKKYKAQGTASMAVGQQGAVLTAGAVEFDSGGYVTVGATKYSFGDGVAVGVAGDKAELLSGEVYLGKDKSILVHGCVYTGNETELHAQLAYDGEGSAVKLELGFVKFDKGSLEAGGVVYTTETGAAISTLGSDIFTIGSEKVWLDEGTVKFAEGTIYVTDDDVDCAYTAVGKGGATVALGEDRQVKVGLEKEESILIDGEEYKAGGAGATLTHSDGKIELTAGTVTLAAGKSIYIEGKNYTAATGGATFALGANDTVTLTGGTVSLAEGESIVINDTVYEAVTGTATLTMVQDSPAQTRVELTGEASLTIDGRQYDAGSQGADFIFDSSDSNITFNSGEASVVLGAEEDILANGSRYAATGQAELNLAKDKVQLVSGEVKLVKDGTSIYAGQGEYKSVEGYTTVTVDAEKQAVLTYGSVEFVEDSSLSVAGKVYNAKAGTILRLDEPPEGKEIAVLYSGAVALQTGQSIHTRSSHTYTAREGGAVFTYTPDHDGIDEALELREGTLHFDGSIAVKAGGRDYYVAENGTVLACAGAYGQEQTVSLKAGGVYFADGVSIEVGDTTYKAPKEAGVRLSVNEDGKAELAADSKVQFSKGSLVIDGVEYVNASDTQEVVMCGGGPSGAATVEKGKVKAELPSGKEVSVNRKTYKAEGGSVLTLSVEEGQTAQANVKLSGKANVTVDGKAYTAGEAGANLDCTGEEVKLVSGEVVLGEGESIVANKGANVVVGETTYTAAKSGTLLANSDGTAKLTKGAVKLDNGESVVAAYGTKVV
ncbi:hypothetical protein, partial [Selenomonas sp. KH1T6]|uniref:hypothetical protein n=1 Tax=Selenomonas sp. KH1T6 TaxID=3158784 RepID=UPI0008A7CC99